MPRPERFAGSILRACLLLAPLAAIHALQPAAAMAQDAGDYVIEFTETGVRPPVLEVPADTRLKLVLKNLTGGAVEFESLTLRKEKVLSPGATSFLIIRGLAPGEYSFFDDFHPGLPPARLVAR